ncbi:MAG: hypothetical protein WBD31_27900 [Rubripirellula sp.]
MSTEMTPKHMFLPTDDLTRLWWAVSKDAKDVVLASQMPELVAAVLNADYVPVGSDKSE